MSIAFKADQRRSGSVPNILVIGIGGAGLNVINSMLTTETMDAAIECLACDTNISNLQSSKAHEKIHLESPQSKELGAGGRPEIGYEAAQACLDKIKPKIAKADIVFMAAGMGGGTGTGALPVIAQAAQEAGVLTIAVVSKPFTFEGSRRMQVAEAGIENLEALVDSLIVIPNQNLFQIANNKTTFAEAFRMVDEVLHSCIKNICDLMVRPGDINLDFADVKTVMTRKGRTVFGNGIGEGKDRALNAAKDALSAPLLDKNSLSGAEALLINYTCGTDVALFEIDEAMGLISQHIGEDALIILGTRYDDDSQGKLQIFFVATGVKT